MILCCFFRLGIHTNHVRYDLQLLPNKNIWNVRNRTNEQREIKLLLCAMGLNAKICCALKNIKTRKITRIRVRTWQHQVHRGRENERDILRILHADISIDFWVNFLRWQHKRDNFKMRLESCWWLLCAVWFCYAFESFDRRSFLFGRHSLFKYKLNIWTKIACHAIHIQWIRMENLPFFQAKMF